MQNKIKELEKKVQQLEKENDTMQREAAWANSWLHRIANMVFLYMAVAGFMNITGTSGALIKGLLPVVVYLSSLMFAKYCKGLFIKHECKISNK